MLECGTNFKGTLKTNCKTCNVTDNESHRLNDCPTYTTHEPHSPAPRVNFDDILSNEKNILSNILKAIEQIWNTKTAHGSVKT